MRLRNIFTQIATHWAIYRDKNAFSSTLVTALYSKCYKAAKEKVLYKLLKGR